MKLVSLFNVSQRGRRGRDGRRGITLCVIAGNEWRLIGSKNVLCDAPSIVATDPQFSGMNTYGIYAGAQITGWIVRSAASDDTQLWCNTSQHLTYLMRIRDTSCCHNNPILVMANCRCSTKCGDIAPRQAPRFRIRSNLRVRLPWFRLPQIQLHQMHLNRF